MNLRASPVDSIAEHFGVLAELRDVGSSATWVVPFFAMAGQGRERGTPDSEHDAVSTIAAARGVTPAQVRLAWTLQQGPHVLAIPGTGHPDHLAANADAAALRLSPGEMARLEGIS